jgi:hypothetical protein
LVVKKMIYAAFGWVGAWNGSPRSGALYVDQSNALEHSAPNPGRDAMRRRSASLP